MTICMTVYICIYIFTYLDIFTSMYKVPIECHTHLLLETIGDFLIRFYHLLICYQCMPIEFCHVGFSGKDHPYF